MEVAGKDNHSLHSLIPKKSTHSFHFCLAKDKNDIITVIVNVTSSATNSRLLTMS